MKIPKIKIPRKYKRKLIFTYKLLFLGIIFYGVWMLSPTFHLMKIFTATLVSYTTGATLISDINGVFVKRGDFLLRIVTDCTAWKELYVFLALFISWPKKKRYIRALYAVAAILLFNLVRLDILVFFPQSFDYFHPAFQYISVAFILLLWTWSVGLVKIKTRFLPWKKRRKSRKKGKKKKRKTKKRKKRK